MDSASKYGYDLESQAYVLAVLSMGVMKRTFPEFNYVGEFSEEIRKKVIDLGVKLLKGEIKPEKYATEYQDLALQCLPKDKRKDVKFDDYTKAQISGRVGNSFSSAVKGKLREGNCGGMTKKESAIDTNDASAQPNSLPSNNQIGDEVTMSFGKEGTLNGTISGIHFDAGKVSYDIDVPLTDNDKTTIYNVDSVVVNAEVPPSDEQLKEAWSNIKLK